MFDAEIVIFIHNIFIASTIGQWIAIALARAWIFLFIPVLFWLWIHGSNQEKHAVKEALWSFGLAVFGSELLSILFLRDRPFLAITEVVTLIPAPLTTSFPSTHASAATALAVALYYANKKAGRIGFLIAFGVMLGRIAVGVHYFTDIFGGIILGLLSFALIRFGHQALRKAKKKIRTV